MFHNLLMTGIAPLDTKPEISSWENTPFSTVWPTDKQRSPKDKAHTKTIRKKPKRVRTAFTTDQLRTLEKIFTQQKYIGAQQRRDIAQSLNVGDKIIKIWFQNRRMKEKKESSASGCDSSCESYTTISPPPLHYQHQYPEDPLTQPISDPTIPKLEVPEYELPNFSVHHTLPNQYNQYVPNMAPHGSTFGYDTNIYPTQYYPNKPYYNADNSQYFINNNESNWPDYTYNWV